MFNYIIRRLLLLIPTFFGTTFLVFFILQIAPSGPFEQALFDIQNANMQQGESDAGNSDNLGDNNISPEILEKLKREYGLDRSIFTRYLIWLGFAKKELEYREIPMGIPFKYTIKQVGELENGIPISLQKWIVATIENNKHVLYETISGTDFPIQGYKTIEEIDLGLEKNWTKSRWMNGPVIGFVSNMFNPSSIKINLNEPFKYNFYLTAPDRIVRILVPKELRKFHPVYEQKWLIVKIEDDKHVLYETVDSGTSFPKKGYKKISDVGLNWKASGESIDLNTLEIIQNQALFFEHDLQL